MTRFADGLPRWSEPRAVFRCPGCGAEVSLPIRARSVGTVAMPHEDLCVWLAAVERGVPVVPVRVEVVVEDRP